MDIREAADFLGMNEEVLRRWAREGRVPAGKLGREWRFSRRLLIAFIEQQATPSREPAVPVALQA